MQVVNNKAGGQLFIGTNQAAVELKRGHNPLGVSVLIQLEPEKSQPGRGRYRMDWYATTLDDEVEAPEGNRAAADAFLRVDWNIDSMVADAGADECPDFYDEGDLKGHLSIICRACQLLSQGLTVMVQGTSAGPPTYISHGRLVSLFISPQF